MTLPLGLAGNEIAWMALALFGAAFVRGYSGFGFAALVVTSAALVMDPMHVVPVVLLADALLTIQQARGIRTHIDWRRVGALFAGCIIGVPMGVHALDAMGVDTGRAVISVYVLAMCGLLFLGWRLRGHVGRMGHAAVGVISGLANGAAVGGLPVAVFFAAQPIPAAMFRATLIAYFTLLDLWTLPVMAHAGRITGETFVATALAMPIVSLGVWLGGRHFLWTDPQNFRRFAILLLAALASLGLVKSVV